MNHLDAFTMPVPGGHVAMCRFSHNAEAWPVLEDDAPKVFAVKKDALIAAQAHVIQHINGTMRRSGTKCSAAKIAAEKIFRKGKVIPVERKGAAR